MICSESATQDLTRLAVPLPWIKDSPNRFSMEAGVDTPSGVCLYKEDSDCSLESLGLSFPVVVKPCSGGSSIGVYIVNTEDEYRQALKNSFRYEDEVVIEDYIKGREFACGVIDGKALPPIEIIPKSGWFDYANKYQDGCD